MPHPKVITKLLNLEKAQELILLPQKRTRIAFQFLKRIDTYNAPEKVQNDQTSKSIFILGSEINLHQSENTKRKFN